MIRCGCCGHSWLEGRAIEVISAPPRQMPAVIEPSNEPDHEVRRLMDAAREAGEKFAANRRQTYRRLRSWAALMAALMLPPILATMFPEIVVKLAPVTVQAYEALGRSVNIYGLDIRRIELQHLIDGGTRVLAVKGEIANISGGERKIPWLRFGLADGRAGEVYNWTLDTGSRPLQPGETTTFVTRVASPPETARNLQIRFAHASEIRLDAAP